MLSIFEECERVNSRSIGVGRKFLEKFFGGKGVGREIGLDIPTIINLVG